MDAHDIVGASAIKALGTTNILYLMGCDSTYASHISIRGKFGGGSPGDIEFYMANAAYTAIHNALTVRGKTDTPIVDVFYGLDMNDKLIYDPKNHAATALSGTKKLVEIDIGGTPYYVEVYPTKA